MVPIFEFARKKKHSVSSVKFTDKFKVDPEKTNNPLDATFGKNHHPFEIRESIENSLDDGVVEEPNSLLSLPREIA